ncbi:hypothetical protein C8F01DRAFT_292491 [Mycena amicta]|nr:hypothetical protein C8F01DRAFT_292491 [Mycena amicta]
MLVQQANRNFVRIPLITRNTLRVVHFDREGPHASPPFDYHEQSGAVLLVKLILLFNSLDEAEVGYDTSIFWENGERYITLEAPSFWNGHAWVAREGGPINLQIAGDPLTPIFFRRTIRSRGTKCWLVEDPNDSNVQWYVKDDWMAGRRTCESEFLKEVRGVHGVGEMYYWQDSLAEVYAQRCHFDTKETIRRTYGDGARVGNRSLMRVVLKKYAGCLSDAKTAIQLLRATRDIVLGHQAVFFVKKILHRDISINNLLLTSESEQLSLPEAPSPPYGVLIDFDMAKRLENNGTSTAGDGKTGTRAFQSVKVLFEDVALGPHDHMDDLESLFYVLCYVCHGHDEVYGRLLSNDDLPRHLKQWTDSGLETALAEIKRDFMLNGAVVPVSRFTGREAETLFGLFARVFPATDSRNQHSSK